MSEESDLAGIPQEQLVDHAPGRLEGWKLDVDLFCFSLICKSEINQASGFPKSEIGGDHKHEPRVFNGTNL